MTFVLTIAGLDPSNGAGLTADIKTFEAHRIYGLSVCTAITIQHENKFIQVEWVSCELILQQLDILLEKYEFTFVKIGIIENLDILMIVIQHLRKKNPGVKIIWDPILEASAGFEFHKKIQQQKLHDITRSCYLITPNRSEWEKLFKSESKNCTCNIYLKGGHDKGEQVVDLLFQKDKEIIRFQDKRLPNTKHGTGCVLSSAITANLAKGSTLNLACRMAKNYVIQFINSNTTLLGKHNFRND